MQVCFADTVSVACTSPLVSAPYGGGTVNASINCIIDAPNATANYRISASNNNFITPGSANVLQGLAAITGTRQTAVISPDNSITSISGTSTGFTGSFTAGNVPRNIRFQYAFTTTSGTASGTYASFLVLPAFNYQVCTNPTCSGQNFSGIVPTSLSVYVPATPVSVACTSPVTAATAGGGPFTISVVCATTGGNPTQFSPSAQNVFTPASITLSQGASNLTATLSPTVSSPDASLGTISGTASAGFTGTVNVTPTKIQIQYSGATTATTPAGSYTSTPVTFAWSTI